MICCLVFNWRFKTQSQTYSSHSIMWDRLPVPTIAEPLMACGFGRNPHGQFCLRYNRVLQWWSTGMLQVGEPGPSTISIYLAIWPGASYLIFLSLPNNINSIKKISRLWTDHAASSSTQWELNKYSYYYTSTVTGHLERINRKHRLKLYFRSDGDNRCTQNFIANRSRMHIPLESTQNTLQGRPYAGPQNI